MAKFEHITLNLNNKDILNLEQLSLKQKEKLDMR